MTLTEFLTARLDEDEAMARGSDVDGHDFGVISYEGALGYAEILSVGRDRALAEVEAKRRIVAYETAARTMLPGKPWDSEIYWSDGSGVELRDANDNYVAHGEAAQALIEQYSDPVTDTPVLRELAEVYADHPDYDERWRP